MQEIVLGNERAKLGNKLGGGKEGDVYSLKGDPSRAVKIYKHDKRQTRAEKIHAIVSANLGQKTSLVAFPLQVATSNSGEFLGFSMRLMTDRREIQQLYNPRSRLHYYPEVDYRFVVRVAQNVARAVGTVNSLKGSAPQDLACVIGDLNYSGLLVAKDATVALINADRFQYTINEKIYPCVVGMPGFTPPELHANGSDNVLRTKMHNNFGLAVTIFHLLFMGRHPYAGRYTGPVVSLGEAIARNRFAYSTTRQSATRTVLPHGVLTLDTFPDKISNKFENAFGLEPDARPSAEDWITALSSFERSLTRCVDVTTHYYPSSSKNCVWCDLKGNGSFDMFPDFSVEKLSPPIKAETCSSSSSGKAERTSRNQNPAPPTNKNVKDTLDTPHNGATNNLGCLRCKKINKPGASYCYSCGLPLASKANPDLAIDKIDSRAKKNGCLGRLITTVIYAIILLFAILIVLDWFDALAVEIQNGSHLM